mgnify:CR=1 FL=1
MPRQRRTSRKSTNNRQHSQIPVKTNRMVNPRSWRDDTWEYNLDVFNQRSLMNYRSNQISIGTQTDETKDHRKVDISIRCQVFDGVIMKITLGLLCVMLFTYLWR